MAACERRVVTCVRVTVTCESDRVWSDASPRSAGGDTRGRARVGLASGSASRGARPPALPYSTTPCTYIKIWLSLICHMVRFFATVPYKNTLCLKLAHGFLPSPAHAHVHVWNPRSGCILCSEHDYRCRGASMRTRLSRDQLGNPSRTPLGPRVSSIAYKGGRPAGSAPSGEPTFVGVAACLGPAGLGELGGLMGSCPGPS